MSYINWNEEKYELKTYRWCRVADVINYLQEVVEFILKRSDTEYSSLTPPKLKYFDIPIVDSANNRFPKSELILCSEFGSWRAEIDLLQLSITVICNSNRLERDYPDYKTVGEAEVNAIKRVCKIKSCIVSDCWDQADFERYCNLLWIEDHDENTN